MPTMTRRVATHLYERVANLGQTSHHFVLVSCAAVPPQATTEMRHRRASAAVLSWGQGWMGEAHGGRRRQLSRDAACNGSDAHDL